MSIAINSNFERDQYVASFTGQVQFTYSFPIYAETYLTVYQYEAADMPDDPTQELVLGVDYTVSGVGEEAGGFITLSTGATAGDIITIVGAQPIQRESVFQDLNPFTVALNQQLNQMTIMIQQIYTYWANLSPHYNFDELVSAPQGFSNGVRPFKLILPMLPDGHVWVGRGEIGDIPDDITTQFIGGAGSGNVISTGDPMRQSITTWTGTHTEVTDNNININGNLFVPTVGVPAHSVSGFGDEWGATHIPVHGTSDRPTSPSDGDIYYDSSDPGFFGYINGEWVPFSSGGALRRTITQTGNPFFPGDLVRVDMTSAEYEYSFAIDDEQAETYGMVVEKIDDNTFILQTGGFVAAGVLSGLIPGKVYFLSDNVPGGYSPNVPTAIGHVRVAVIRAETANTFYLPHFQGFIIGNSSPPPPPPPSLGQFIFADDTSPYQTMTADWETVLCSTITPTDVAHRVWIVADFAAGAAGSGQPVYFRITRDGTPIFVGDAAGLRLQASGGVGHHFAGNPTNWFANFIDSPGSVSAVIYCVQIRSPGGAGAYVNRTSTDSNSTLFGRETSSLTLIEVQA